MYLEKLFLVFFSLKFLIKYVENLEKNWTVKTITIVRKKSYFVNNIWFSIFLGNLEKLCDLKTFEI